MAQPFTRTLRSVAADSQRLALWSVVAVVVVLAAWIVWFVAARVSLFEVATDARLEATRAPHPLHSPVLGRVVEVHLEVGARVGAGDTLVVLETAVESSRLEELEQRLESLRAQRVSQVEAQRADGLAMEREERAEAAELKRAREMLREVAAELELARVDLERQRQLSARGLLPAAELDAAVALLDRLQAEHDAATTGVAELDWTHQGHAEGRAVRRSEHARKLAALDGEIAAAAAARSGREHDVQQRRIRAPVDGLVGEVSTVRPGSVVDEGELVAVVVPDGSLQIVATVGSARAIGRVRAGQRARLRLHAYPWVRFGQIEARVARVGLEAVDGGVRVELDALEAPPAIPLQHGLEGTLEIEVDRLSPADLLLRVVGRAAAGASGGRAG
jgi:membrane fusion protein (multidrug efflux system)